MRLSARSPVKTLVGQVHQSCSRNTSARSLIGSRPLTSWVCIIHVGFTYDTDLARYPLPVSAGIRYEGAISRPFRFPELTVQVTMRLPAFTAIPFGLWSVRDEFRIMGLRYKGTQTRHRIGGFVQWQQGFPLSLLHNYRGSGARGWPPARPPGFRHRIPGSPVRPGGRVPSSAGRCASEWRRGRSTAEFCKKFP